MLALHQACAEAAGVTAEPALRAAPGSATCAARRSTSRSRGPSSGSAPRTPLADGLAATWAWAIREWTRVGVRAAPAKSEAPWTPRFSRPQDLVRPWRRATVVASAVAAVELVLLLALGAMLVAKPLSHAIEHHAVASASRPAAIVSAPAEEGSGGDPPHARARRQGAAARPRADHGPERQRPGRRGRDEAGRLQHLGYKISGTANAHRQDYASSVVMYVAGYRAEGMRLGKDLGVKVVGAARRGRPQRAARRPARRDRRRLERSRSAFRLAGVHAQQGRLRTPCA